ncbi:MAG: radical SAM protein [Candidatus Omnitrophica bacterium]|nr:radical SAM protein [Candidatus Omnitrophota bacterium]
MKYKFKMLLNKALVALFILKILNGRSFLKVLRFIISKYCLGKKSPALAVLALTYKCQCRCVHCSAGNFRTSSEELTVDAWKKVIDALDALGVPRIHISGGEPTLKQGVDDIIRYAASKGMVTFLETNGFALDESLVLKLKAAGVASIDISLDSTDAGTHDKLRCLDRSFDKAMHAIDLCRKHKMVYMVSSYATKENIFSGELKKVMVLAQQVKASAIRIMPPQPSGRWMTHSPEQLKDADKKYFRQQFPVMAVLDRTDLPQCPIANRYTIFIAPDGEMHPCPHLPFSFGNVRTMSIGAALDKMANDSMFKKKALCYINDAGFRKQYIEPVLAKNAELPVKI